MASRKVMPGDELVHRLQRIVVDPADDLVEPVVDRALAVGLVVPRGESVLDAFTGALHREVDDRRGAAERGRARAGLERVRRERATERELHVRVAVDPTRDDVLPRRVDDLVGRDVEVGAEDRGGRLDEATMRSPSISTSAGCRPVGPTTVPLAMSVVMRRLLRSRRPLP
jgi:hypothetical protein